MLRRAPEHGGFWQGVSGRLERRDASYAAAAQREITEETGLRTEHMALLDLGGAATFQGVVSGRWFHKRVLGAVFPREIAAEEVVLSAEHDVARRVDFQEARRLVDFPENRSALRDFEVWLQDVRGRKR
jgi:8-oxo-dGTP pyrophosphatase MutT (NUDIX family)